MPNMAYSWRGDYLLVVHSASPPTEAEWDDYVASIRAHDVVRIRNLVFTDGGAPNSTQRKQVTEALNGRTVPAAVVSPSNLVRGVVTALSWFNPKIKAFSPNELEQAIKYLGISGPDVPVLLAEMKRLRAQVAQAPVKQ